MWNWAGNVEYRARRLLRPGSVGELQDLVRHAEGRLRPLGSRHTFNALPDTDGDLLSLADLPRIFQVDRSNSTVTVDGGVRYGDVCAAIDQAGFALHAMASLPHISVAGGCATGTHGSGDAIGNLATAVMAMDLVTPDGELRHVDRVDDDIPLAGAVVALGALGVVTRLTLRVEPTYLVRQDVFEGLPLAAFLADIDGVMACGDSVSAFLDWTRPAIDQVWVKRRVADGDHAIPAALAGAHPADGPRHPIRGHPADACTTQLGEPGPWHERLPHFRLDHLPSSGEEIQTEYLVPRAAAGEALEALYGMRRRLAPLTLVSEIRTVAADDLWLSPAFDQPTVAIHFTWRRDAAAVDALLPDLERSLERFAPRPHWGKRFAMDAAVIRERYPRLPDFVALADRVDPEHRFRNDFLRRHVIGGPGGGG